MKRIFFFLALVFGFVSAFAYVEVDGIYYNLDPENMTAQVTADNWWYTKYSGDIIIPESIISSDQEYIVNGIGDFAFGECKDLTSVSIPNSVTIIGQGAFSGCSSLTDVEIPNSVTSMGGSVFRDCNSLTHIEIPGSISSIGASAFYGCSNLISVEIPGSVTSIGRSAFRGCTSLAGKPDFSCHS